MVKLKKPFNHNLYRFFCLFLTNENNNNNNKLLTNIQKQTNKHIQVLTHFFVG